MTQAAPLRERSPAFTRRPSVAGYYYPDDPAALAAQVDALTIAAQEPRPARGVIAPHGSLARSGAIAGAAFRQVQIPKRCIVLGPSHTGSAMAWSLMADGAYRTPLGEVPVDAECAGALRARCPFLEVDAWAQRGEHAVEAVLPFLQRRGPANLRVAPIITGMPDEDQIERLADALIEVLQSAGEPMLLVASSDLSHYEPEAEGAAQDQELLRLIGQLDGTGLLRYVQEARSAMCGAGAVACVLEAARGLGAQRARVARYGTSADAGGDPGAVIGYAGIVV